MRSRSLVLATGIIFLIVSFGCSHSPPKSPSPDPREEISSRKEIARSLGTPKDDEPWWKKDENQWLFAVLIFLGIGIAIGGTIWMASGAGGLSVQIHK
jgi:hypothetical protein